MKKALLTLLILTPFLLQAQLTTTISKTDITCFGDSNGTATVNGGVVGASAPIMISEVNVNTPDFIELTNVSGQTVNTDGWFVITSDDYSNINDANANSWSLPTSVSSGWVDYREDATGSAYWGSNLFYSSGQPGWVLLSDDQGNIQDFVAWGWTETQILNTYSVSFGGFTFDITTSDWTGNGVSASCSSSFVRSGSEDNDDNTDWSCTTPSKGNLNSGLTLPFLGGVGIDYSWNTGDTTNTITDLGPGTYYVTTTSSQGDTAMDTVTIIEPPIPSFDLPEDTLLCSGEAVIVDAGNGWSSYLWSNGSTAQNLLLTSAGTYICTVTDTNGCPATDSIMVIAGESPDLDLGGDTIICDSQYILDAGNPGSTYLWSNGDFTQTTLIEGTDVYTVTVTSQDGCEATDDIYVQMFEPAIVDLGEDFTLCVNYGQTDFLNAGPGFSSYAWSTGATSTTLLVGSGVTQAGSEIFWVEVETDDGCLGRDSVEVTYEICTGVNNLADANIEMFPNPSSGIVQILASGASISAVNVMDITGKVVHTQSTAGTSVQNVLLDLSALTPGNYIVNVLSGDESRMLRLVKQ